MAKLDENYLTEKQAEKQYWSDYYELCKKCKNTCKQSSKVIQVLCSNFESIG